MAIAPHAERARLNLEGMRCASYATRIVRKLNKLDGVEATVNYATDEAAVTFDADEITVSDQLAAVEAAGYHAALPGERVETDQVAARRIRLVVETCAPPRTRFVDSNSLRPQGS